MSSSSTITTTNCYHCGERCVEDEIVSDKKSFCCAGCKTVFEILNNYDLCAYYELDKTAGNTIPNGIERKRFDYLKDADVIEKLIDFRNGTTVSVSFFIPNIHCPSCIWLLENLQNIDDGILSGKVNFLNRKATFVYNSSSTSLRNIVELLSTIGYEPNLKLDQLKSNQKDATDRRLWLKFGVAGFCFGNIMLFSFPEYLNLDQSGSSSSFKIFFGTLNIVLALPVLLYSSIDYLKSAWAALSQKGINLDVPISIGIIALFGRSLYEILSGTGSGYFDSFTGFIFFLLIGKIVQKKTFEQLSFNRDYKSYLPISVIKVSEDKEESVPVDKLEIGDHVTIRNQELIPADAVLMSDEAQIDYSFITGESEPVRVEKGALAFAGGKVIGAQSNFLISKKVEHSYLTQLWENEAFKNGDEKISVTSFADRISPFFTFIVIGIALLSLLIWLQIEPTKAFTIFTAVLIVACPCALALSTPFTLGSALNILAQNGLFVRSTSVLESLSNTDTITFDKTGTITESGNSKIDFVGSSLSTDELRFISSSCRTSTHPLSKTIYRELDSKNLLVPDSIHEVSGKGLFANFGDTFLWIGSQDFLIEQTSLSQSDLLSLSASGSVVHVCIDNEYKGYFRFENSLRDGIGSLFAKLSNTYSTFLLSGDNEKESSRLTGLFPNRKSMLFNQSPFQKLNFIENLKQQGKQVLMVGDGLNDAGALKTSSFGIAISDDTSAFSPACDAIAEGASIKKLDTYLRFTKASFRVILFSFGISLCYNLIGLGFAVTGHLSPLVAAILMPLSSVTIMAFTYSVTRIIAYRMGLKIWE